MARNDLIIGLQQPRNGSWNMIYQSFHKPKALLSWGILNYSRVSDQIINRFINTLLNACRKIGAIRLFIFCASQTNLSIVGMSKYDVEFNF